MSKNLTWDSLAKWAFAALITLFAWQFNEFNSTLKDNTNAITSIKIDIADIHGDLKVIKSNLGIRTDIEARNLTQIIAK